MRQFESGATRDGDHDKLNFAGFLSHLVLVRYAEYMHKNRKQADGKLRDADNWKKGIPTQAYMDSMFRHFMEVYGDVSGETPAPHGREEALCALLFNVMGMLHEELRGKRGQDKIYSEDDQPQDVFTVSSLSRVERGEVLGVPTERAPGQVAEVASEVRGFGGITAIIPKWK